MPRLCDVNLLNKETDG